jgi:hypothetical protein
MSPSLPPSGAAGEPRFAPRDGALLDLGSLDALAAVPDRLLRAWAGVLCPGQPGLVLEGLDLDDPLSAVGPPGTRRPDSAGAGLTLSPGRVLLVDGDGTHIVLSVPRPVFAAWPTRAGAGVEGALVLRARRAPAAEPGVQVAREDVFAEVGFVRADEATRPGLLVLAAALGNGRDWITDLHRVWAPEHPAVALVERRLDDIERLIWKAEPEGSVWDRQVIGRNWVRYQTMAAAALQAARQSLRSRTMTTAERVRLFAALRDQLAASVQPAATALLQLFRPADGAGPYRVLSEAEAS